MVMDNDNKGVLAKIGVLMAGAAFSIAAQAAEPPHSPAAEPLPDMTHFAQAYKDAVITPRTVKIPLCDKLDAPPPDKFRIIVAETPDSRLTFNGSKFRFRKEF